VKVDPSREGGSVSTRYVNLEGSVVRRSPASTRFCQRKVRSNVDPPIEERIGEKKLSDTSQTQVGD
jgi:hypothetical protein